MPIPRSLSLRPLSLRPLAPLAALLPLAALAQDPTATPLLPGPAVVRSDPGLPKWEAGLVVGGGRVADYPGADRSDTRGLLAPVLIYRGDVLRIEGNSIRGRVARSSDWELDLSASAAFNSRSNPARRGMPALDYMFGLGPQLVYKGLRDWPGSPALHLNARAVMSTDFSGIEHRGAVLDPELRWRLDPALGVPARVTFGVQPTWASRSLQRYFYGVSPEQATVWRPAYEARAGYLGTEFKLTVSRNLSRSASWFAGLRALSLHGAANEASPLLRDRSNFSVGAGLSWTPWRSAERAAD